MPYPLNMGRTLPTASIIFLRMKDGLKTFQSALSPRDQRALEELFVIASKHIAEVQYTADLPPKIGPL
jgi:hypothetical protein